MRKLVSDSKCCCNLKRIMEHCRKVPLFPRSTGMRECRIWRANERLDSLILRAIHEMRISEYIDYCGSFIFVAHADSEYLKVTRVVIRSESTWSVAAVVDKLFSIWCRVITTTRTRWFLTGFLSSQCLRLSFTELWESYEGSSWRPNKSQSYLSSTNFSQVYGSMQAL